MAGQNPPSGGVGQGVSGGTTAGVAQGVIGGMAGGVARGIKGGVGNGVREGVGQGATDGSPTVDRSTIWTDTVKRGSMVRQVRGLGTLVRGEHSGTLVARVMLPEAMTPDVRLNENATVDTRKSLVQGHVGRISPEVSDGARSVDIVLNAALPEGVGVDLPVDGTIDIEKIDVVVYVGRPVHGTQNASISLF